jgi:hypothetical protein
MRRDAESVAAVGSCQISDSSTKTSNVFGVAGRLGARRI